MHWQYNPYVLPLAIAAAVSAALAFLAWRRRPAPGATPLALLMLAVAEWSLGYALELGSADLPSEVFWAKVEYLGIVSVSVTWLALVLQYTGREKWLTRRNVALLVIVPLVTLLLVWTNEAHGLIWSNIKQDTSGSFLVLDLTYGAGFWVNWMYSYLLLLLGTLLVVQALIRSPRLYRRQAAALLIGALVPWVGNALYVSGLSPFPHLDLTPFAFTLTGLVATWALFRFRLLDIVPVARDAVIEGMSDGVIVLDAQNRIVDLNPAAERIIGRSAAEAIGQPLNIADLGLRIADLEVQDFHSEIHIPQSAMTFDLRISPLYDRHGRLTGRLAVLRDITERKQMEEEMRQSEEKYRVLAESSPNGIFISDVERFIYVNQRLCEITGFSGDELLNMPDPVGSLFAPEEWERVLAYAQSRLRGGPAPTSYEARGIRKDGEEISLKLAVSSIVFSGRRVLQGTVEDITERKRAEEELRESEGRYRSLMDDVIDTSAVGIFILDKNFQVVWVNQALEQFFGLRRDKVAGRDKRELIGERIKYAFEDPEVFAETVLATYDNNTYVENFECHVLPHGEREERWLQHWSRPIRSGLYAGGRVELYYDITERKRAEEQIRQRAAQLEALRQVGLEITTELDPDALLRSIVSRAIELVGGTTGGLYLYRPEGDVLEWAVAVGPYLSPIGTILRRSEGLSGKVWETNEPLIVDDYQQWKGRAAVYEGYLFRAVVGVPVRWGEEFLGVLNVLMDPPHTFSPADAELLSLFATQAAITIHNARLYEETRRRAEELGLLFQAARDTSASLEPADVMYRLAEFICQAADATSADVLILDEISTRATVVAQYIGPEASPAESKLDDGTAYDLTRYPVIREIVRTGQPAITHADDPALDSATYQMMTQFGGCSALRVPLLFGGVLRGYVLVWDSRRRHEWDEDTVRLCQTLAGLATVALENARLYAEVQQLATTDPLTDLPNRRLLNDRLNLALAHAHRNQQRLVVMLLDLDHFKDVNDTLGHSVGDKLLQVVGERLAGLLRKSDTIARMGGDEFMLLLPEIAGGEDVAKAAAKILEAIRRPFVLDGHEIHTTTSIGIALYPDDGEDVDTLVKNADIAMYRAKDQGRDNYQRYMPAMSVKALE